MRESGEETIVVDAGDWMGGADELGALKSRHLLGTMAAYGLDAAAVGEEEMSRGFAFVRELADSCGVTLVASNLTMKDGSEFAKPMVIRTVGARSFGPFKTGGYRIGVFALLGAYQQRIMGARGDSIELADPLETSTRMVKELREQHNCRMVILLSHLGLDLSKRLAREVAGIDLIVVGHGGSRLNDPERYGEAFLVHGGSQGAEIGDMSWNIGPEGPAIMESHRIVEFSQDVETVPDGDARLAGYKEDYRAFLEDPQEYPEELKRTTQVLAGVDDCNECHPAEVASWRSTAHAHAFATLEETGDDIMPDCVRCHVTGYNYANGFRHRKWTPHFQDVQCEACHGPAASHAEFERARAQGSPHPAPMPFREINDMLCRACHDAKNDPDFDFDRDLRPILHGAMSPAGAGGGGH